MLFPLIIFIMFLCYFYLYIFYHLFLLSMFFFFKQKTAYDMRISDWSSDVCSSDLRQPDHAIRIRNETLDFLVQRPDPGRVIEVDDRHVLIEDLARRVVARLAILVVAALARLVQQLVHLRVAVLRIVDAALAGDELVQVAVGIDAARPADQIGRVGAGVLRCGSEERRVGEEGVRSGR